MEQIKAVIKNEILKKDKVFKFSFWVASKALTFNFDHFKDFLEVVLLANSLRLTLLCNVWGNKYI